MNFYSILIWEIIIVGALLIYFFARDIKTNSRFLNRHKKTGITLIFILLLGIGLAIYTRFIEPFHLMTTSIAISAPVTTPVKIAFISDIQIGNHKKTSWTEKTVAAIEKAQPDIVILGGDLIDNEGAFEDESIYLEPLQKIVSIYPIYYVLGNHEYGIGSNVKDDPQHYYGDRSQLLINRMEKIGAKLLRNNLVCLNIKQNNICLFGIDDIWTYNTNFDELKNLPANATLIFTTHNPDGIKLWPAEQKKPAITLAGHSHGGQVYLPFIGVLSDPMIDLGEKYYRGLNNYEGAPIFTSVGAGESGGPIRFLTPPEVVIINLKPQK